MRIEAKLDLGDISAAPGSLYWNKRRIDIIDQWYGADYRYVKVKDDDGGLYILRFNESLTSSTSHIIKAMSKKPSPWRATPIGSSSRRRSSRWTSTSRRGAVI
jgi:hypothetical protein